MPDTTSPHADVRTTREVMNQWRRLAELKRSLVRDGMLDGNATPSQIVEKIRELIPSDLFATP